MKYRKESGENVELYNVFEGVFVKDYGTVCFHE